MVFSSVLLFLPQTYFSHRYASVGTVLLATNISGTAQKKPLILYTEDFLPLVPCFSECVVTSHLSRPSVLLTKGGRQKMQLTWLAASCMGTFGKY